MILSCIKSTFSLALCIIYLFYLIIQLVSIIHLFEFNFSFYCNKSKLIYYMILSLILNTFSLLSFINYIYDYSKIKYDNKNNRYILTLFISVIISNCILFIFGIQEHITNIIECNIQINYRDLIYYNLSFQLILIFVISFSSLLMFNKMYITKYDFIDSKFYV